MRIVDPITPADGLERRPLQAPHGAAILQLVAALESMAGGRLRGHPTRLAVVLGLWLRPTAHAPLELPEPTARELAQGHPHVLQFDDTVPELEQARLIARGCARFILAHVEGAELVVDEDALTAALLDGPTWFAGRLVSS
jgi:hypothetical protein